MAIVQISEEYLWGLHTKHEEWLADPTMAVCTPDSLCLCTIARHRSIALHLKAGIHCSDVSMLNICCTAGELAAEQEEQRQCAVDAGQPRHSSCSTRGPVCSSP